ncbi:MAG TPA: bifunctional riboflavin kinase/FAD synthetase [Verrucomicrobiae bacterium]|nr:bifunctional riboflavin kinase/FAD synthetase [Verrucomicrobiae bacterium]
MKIVRAANELKAGGKKICLAIGFFDGVHLGHQQIIRQTISDARQHDAISVVLTFDRHPNSIVAPEKNPPLIYSLPQKLRTIESLGAEAVLLVAFDQKFSEQSGEGFVRNLVREIGKIHSICVGANFIFGHKRSGNVELLGQLGKELNFQVHGLSAVSLDGEAVSSTRIRETIRDGNLDGASQMLGRPYSICGKVIAGDRLGGKIGFPTANLDVAGLILPPRGVYSGCLKFNGEFYRAAINIGVRPTVAAGKPDLRFEAYILDFSGDLYGMELEIEITGKIRPEMKFDSVTELRRQIESDVAAVRSLP